jgi:hypothetical protein
MAVTLYRSTDASAPVLTGQVGSLIALLDAVLVNGYGVKPAAGWTKAFSGTNLAAYRKATTGGTGFYLAADDTGPNVNLGARVARCRGYEAMTAVATGTGPFPTVAQGAAAIQVYKSDTADAAATPWIILADQHTVTILTKPGGQLNGWSCFHYGDIYSLKTGDAYRSIIIGRVNEANPGAMSQDEENMQNLAAVSAVAAGHFMPRTYVGATQAAVAVGKHSGDTAKRGLVPYPNPVDGGLMLAQFWVHEDVGAQGVVRGRLRGLWDFLHDPMVSVNDGDTFSGSGELAGKSFLVVKPLGGIAGAVRVLVLETSNTWETSA